MDEFRSIPEADAAALALPSSRPATDHPTDHIEAALRASGLESEVAEVLPVRGGHGVSDHWGEWEDAAWSGAFGRTSPYLDIDRVRWPASLYIPRNADYRDYWISPPPDRQRYALAWPGVGNGVRPDWADAATGDLFAYTIVPWTTPGADTRSEAGIGILYTPKFALGTVDFQPIINVKDGILASVLEYFPTLSAGHVTLKASVVLAAWQVIPGGYDLIDYAVQPIARITRDQSFGPERAEAARFALHPASVHQAVPGPGSARIPVRGRGPRRGDLDADRFAGPTADRAERRQLQGLQLDHPRDPVHDGRHRPGLPAVARRVRGLSDCSVRTPAPPMRPRRSEG